MLRECGSHHILYFKWCFGVFTFFFRRQRWVLRLHFEHQNQGLFICCIRARCSFALPSETHFWNTEALGQHPADVSDLSGWLHSCSFSPLQCHGPRNGQPWRSGPCQARPRPSACHTIARAMWRTSCLLQPCQSHSIRRLEELISNLTLH